MTPPEHAKQQPMRVLFLCTHNSSRSQMAEGLLHAHGSDAFEVFSAGTHPRTVHPLAIKAMAEVEIDISRQRAKGIEEFTDQLPIDLVVTVCDEAAEECPVFPNARQQVHWSLPDPSIAIGTEQECLAVFRFVCNLITSRIDKFVDREQ